MSKFIKESDLAWLELALKVDGMGMDDCHLSLLHVASGKAYATDGHRMHVAPCDLADGAYCRYDLQISLEKGLMPTIDTDFTIPDGFKPQVEMIKRAGKAFKPDSEVMVSDFYVQNGFYGQLVPKDGSSRFQRIYVLEALFGLTTKGETILHTHTKDGGENFMYANDGERSFLVMGMRLDKENSHGNN